MSRLARAGLLAAAAALVAVAALTADRTAPGSRTVRSVQVYGSQTILRPEGTDPGRRRAWRMRLTLDADIRQPGPEWVMREGRSPGRGYALSWVPAAFALHLQRGGEVPMLLGTARLERPAHEVVFARRGARIAVLVDGDTVIDALDPEGVPEPGGAWPDGWSISADGNMGSATLAVQDDGDLPPAWASDVPPGDGAALERELARGPADPGERDRAGMARRVLAVRGWVPPEQAGRADYALLCVRQALSQRPDRDPHAAEEGLGAAGRAVAALGVGHPGYEPLRLWLAWTETRNALATFGRHELATADGRWSEDPPLEVQLPPSAGDEFALRLGLEIARIRSALDQLTVLAVDHRRPEAAGMLIALLPDLAERAVRRPAVPRPLTQVLAERAAWLAILDRTSRSAQDALGAGAGETLAVQLRFVSHAAGALAGGADPDGPAILPTPADAPAWLTMRWRALAGTDPDPGGAVSLAVPASAQATTPLVLPVVERLVRAAVLEPLAAVRLRAAQLDAVAANDAGQALRPARSDAAPDREIVLSRLIVALHLLADCPPGTGREDAVTEVAQAAAALGPLRSPATARPDALVDRDPLAFALACLANQRLQLLASQSPGSDLQHAVFSPPELSGPFAQLAPFARLLSGTRSATAMIWLHDDSVLPPAQALAAALAMQEVRFRSAGDKGALVGDAVAADWDALHRLPCFTLPLELIDPAPRDRPKPKQPVSAPIP